MPESQNRMDGKTVLITGGTGGIGFVAARRLAERGAKVVIAGRRQDRGDAAIAEIRAAAPEASVRFLGADLSRQDEVRRLADTIADRCERLDVLINNAGVMAGRRTLTADGIEMTFAVNHLAPFLLTHLLLPKLAAAANGSAPARVVVVASRAHQGVKLDFADLQAERRYVGWFVYKRSKLANLYFTYALARRLDPSRTTVNALHPGFVATDIGTANGFLPGPLWSLASRFAISPEAGASTITHLAGAPEVAGAHGEYFVKCRPARSSEVSRDPALAERLWVESARLTGAAEA